jgi:hypothetical protein
MDTCSSIGLEDVKEVFKMNGDPKGNPMSDGCRPCYEPTSEKD